jgi:hypothetical protein
MGKPCQHCLLSRLAVQPSSMEAELWEQEVLVSINHLFVKVHGRGLPGFVCIGCLLRKRNVQVVFLMLESTCISICNTDKWHLAQVLGHPTRQVPAKRMLYSIFFAKVHRPSIHRSFRCCWTHVRHPSFENSSMMKEASIHSPTYFFQSQPSDDCLSTSKSTYLR